MDLPPTPATFSTDEFFLGPSNITSTEIQINEINHASKSNDSRIVSQSRDILNYTEKSSTSSPAEASEPWIAFGSLRLKSAPSQDTPRQWHIQGSQRDEIYPHPFVTTACKRGWIRTVQLSHVIHHDRAVLRLYVLPEDVGRSNRGSVKDQRRIIKWLLNFIDTSKEAWNGSYCDTVALTLYRPPVAAQDESLFYIFNTLDSPEPKIEHFAGPLHSLISFQDSLEDSIPGLATKLYPYQKRSVAAMLQRETDPTKSQDPRKPLYSDKELQPFYFDIFEGVLLHNQQLYADPRGGILAETMGYGKTLICISLILATRGHYPSIPEGRIDNLPPLKQDKTASLLSMAARAVKHEALPWKSEFDILTKSGRHYDRCIKELEKYDRKFAEPIFHPTTPGRKVSNREDSRVLRLCYGTLVIVPPNLLVQWQHEIKKHTEPGALDVLILDKTVSTLPSWKELMTYDVVLISKDRFEQEYRDDDLNQGRRYKGEEKFHSALTDLRWLRVVCDEGHGFAGSASKTNAMAMLDKMSIERRWVVSGTPSSSLHGIEINLATSEVQSESRRDSLTAELQSRRAPDTLEQELKDMDRLKLIVINFLKVQPWANQKGSDHAKWKTYLSPFDEKNKRRCAPGLRTLLQSLMVRHRIEDIDLDLVLPPLYNRTVYLEPSYYDKLSINMFLLVLTSNAVTSERTDEDYMHHPRNRKQLDQLINNLRQSSFHWVGFTVNDIEQTLHVSNNYLDEHLDTISDQDALLLTEAIMNGDRALKDDGWRAFSTLHEIGVYVEDFPEHASGAWSIHGQTSQQLLLGTVQAREAQRFIQKHSEQDDPAAGLIGAGMRAMHSARERALEEQKSKSAKSNASGASVAPNMKAGTGEEPKLKAHVTTSQLESTALSSPIKRKHSGVLLAATSALRSTRITGFTSAKLTYLVSRLLDLQANTSERSIVFYDGNNIAFWLAEALELVHIPFLIYANTLSVGRRASYLATFNSSSSPFRVLLMDLKQAAHGLHIASASRVFIISPIWQPNIESQAIKRAHRIGQDKPVYVETLVLKGTLEEKMLKRRKEMSREELVKAEKSLLDDDVMDGMVKGEGFQKFKESYFDNASAVNDEAKVCKLDKPVPLFGSSMERHALDEFAEDADDGVPRDAKRQRTEKPKKGVRFV